MRGDGLLAYAGDPYHARRSSMNAPGAQSHAQPYSSYSKSLAENYQR